MVARLVCLALVSALAGCPGSATNPEMRVITVRNEAAHEVVYVQVTNPAKRPMRLTKLEYTFAAGSAKLSEGSLELHRDVPAGSAIVVEVPLERDPSSPEAEPVSMTLKGRLTAELDQVLRTFKVSAEIQPDQVVTK